MLRARSYLKSPIVELLVGLGDNQTLLTAHEALLTQSPYFAGLVAEFANTKVRGPP